VTGLADPLRPETFDRLPPDELRGRVKKQVLSKRASNRARRSFFELPPEHEVPVAFRAGFLDFYRAQGPNAGALCALVEERIHAEPPLVIGTHSYRRAMATIDLDDIRQRLAMEPETAFDWCY